MGLILTLCKVLILMPHIFISYAKKDTQDLAFALCDWFDGMDGYSAWVDRSLTAGRSWEGDIQREIVRCDIFVVLYSPDINRHLHDPTATESYVLEELSYAKYTLRKPIIPVMAQTTPPPMGMTRIQYIDFASGGMSINALAQKILQEAGLSAAAPPKATEAPKPQPKPVASPLPAKRSGEGASRSDVGVRAITATADAVKRLLGEPFDWCEVPAGEFIYGDESESNGPKKLTLPGFAIAKYPITYSQFQVFIDAQDGFKEGRWWDGLENQSDKPGDQAWKIKDHPRENVSWTDAMAFCRWLSFKLGGGYAIDKLDEWLIRLPTEFEWEKAARGTDGRLYPYGNDFDTKKGNTSESGISKTTPVTAYPQGASPYGVMDMSGNVWEWCLSDLFNPAPEAKDENISSIFLRVLRGGSWFFNDDFARAVYRDVGGPVNRNGSFGFRVLRPPQAET